MGAALLVLLIGIGALAAGVLIGRYYVPDDRQLRRSARHSRAYIRALSHLLGRDYDTAVSELRGVVDENVDDVEPYFALGAIFRSRGEHERAIRVHQALAMRERDKKKLKQRAMYELGLDFRAAGMPRRATRAMEDVMLEDAGHDGAVRVLAALYEEQARFNEAAGLWQRIGKKKGEDTGEREHHLLVAAAQTALDREDLESAKLLLQAAQKIATSAHLLAAAAELAAARLNYRGARARIRQALALEPALAPHLLPMLIAAEQGVATQPAHGGHADDLEDDAAGAGTGLPAAAPMTRLVAAPTVPAAPTPPVSATPLPAAATTPLLEAAAGDTPAAATVTDTAAATVTGTAAATVTGTAANAVAVADKPAAEAIAARSSEGEQALLTQLRTETASTAPEARRVRFVPGVEVALVQRDAARGGVNPAALPPERGREGPLLIDGQIIMHVLAVLDEVEAQGGPRLEIALMRAQLVPANDRAAQAQLAAQLLERFPDSLAARVAAGRLASASGDAVAIRGALDGLVSDAGALAWTLRGRWQCSHCGNRPAAFSWRCGQCRRWGSLRMETGVEPPPVQPRERRAVPRTARPEGLLGASTDLPAATLDAGLSDAELANAGVRRSLLGRVGGWVSGVLRRDPA